MEDLNAVFETSAVEEVIVTENRVIEGARESDSSGIDIRTGNSIRGSGEVHNYARTLGSNSESLVMRSAVIEEGMDGLRSGVTLASGGHENETSKHIPFKAALEFVPKMFDGYNMPVSKFIRDCLFAHDSIDPRERNHLFWMVRTKVIGTAESSLQDRDIKSLGDLLQHLKITFTEHRNISHLNSLLATVAQQIEETALDYGVRVNKMLKNMIEVIEEKNTPIVAFGMVQSARESAHENFIMGLKKELALRVRVESPKTLQDAMNAARVAEWEYERQNSNNHSESKKYNRFMPY